MNAQIHQIMTAMNAELNPEFYKSLMALFHSVRISLPKFHDDVDYEYLNYIYENVSKKRCDLIMYSRLGKYKVDIFLKEKRSIKNNLTQKTDTEAKSQDIFVDFLNDLHEKSKDFKDQIFPFAGKNNLTSFTTIFEGSGLVNAGYTAKVVKSTLIKCGCLEQIDDKNIKFLTSRPKPLNSDKDTIRQLSNLINHYTSTLHHNRNTPDDDLKIFEQSINSDLIRPEHFANTLTELRDHFRPVLVSGQEVIDSNETKGTKSTHNVGFHIFLYKTKKEK